MKKRVSVKKILLFLLLFLLLAVTGMLVWIFFLPKKYTVMYHMSGNRTIESAEVILYGRQESGEYGYSMYLLEDSHTGKRFTIGTPMRVKLLAASDTTGQIDFAPADGSLPVSEKLDRPRREDTDRAPRGNRAERRRHSGKGRGGKPGKGKKPPTRKRR